MTHCCSEMTFTSRFYIVLPCQLNQMNEHLSLVRPKFQQWTLQLNVATLLCKYCIVNAPFCLMIIFAPDKHIEPNVCRGPFYLCSWISGEKKERRLGQTSWPKGSGTCMVRFAETGLPFLGKMPDFSFFVFYFVSFPSKGWIWVDSVCMRTCFLSGYIFPYSREFWPKIPHIRKFPQVCLGRLRSLSSGMNATQIFVWCSYSLHGAQTSRVRLMCSVKDAGRSRGSCTRAAKYTYQIWGALTHFPSCLPKEITADFPCTHHCLFLCFATAHIPKAVQHFARDKLFEIYLRMLRYAHTRQTRPKIINVSANDTLRLFLIC